MDKREARARLLYWGEPQVAYVVYEVHCYEFDRPNTLSAGFLPVYETKEDAEDAHPGQDVQEILIVPVQSH